jgi:hypothetical protein
MLDLWWWRRTKRGKTPDPSILKALGLPEWRADEAYLGTLRSWRRSQK